MPRGHINHQRRLFCQQAVSDVITRFMTIIFLAIVCCQLTAQTNYVSQMPYRDALAQDVFFWKKIFAKVSVHEFLIHDSEKLNIVYRKVAVDSTLGPRAREKFTDAIKDTIAAILEGTAKGTWPSDSLEDLRREILALFGENPAKAELLRASIRLRAQQGIREKFMAGVKRSYAFLPHIRKVFAQRKLPDFLIYLPHVESSFTPNIVSHAGAAGMWQFMRPTARSFMKVNRVSDERFDPYKSTYGAAKLLAWNYKSIGDWALAVTAYNHGLAGMKRAKRRYGSYMEIREKHLRRSFGFASKNFYPELIAVVEIMDSVDVHFPGLKRDQPQFFQEVKLPRKVGLPSLARRFKIDLDTLKQLNPGYRKSVWKGQRLVPAKYTLRLPLSVNSGEMLAALGASDGDLATTTMVLPQPAGTGLVWKQLGEAKKNRSLFKAELAGSKAGISLAATSAVDWQIAAADGELAITPELDAPWYVAQNSETIKPAAGTDDSNFDIRALEWDNLSLDSGSMLASVVSTDAAQQAVSLAPAEQLAGQLLFAKPEPPGPIARVTTPFDDLSRLATDEALPEINVRQLVASTPVVTTHQPLEVRAGIESPVLSPPAVQSAVNFSLQLTDFSAPGAVPFDKAGVPETLYGESAIAEFVSAPEQPLLVDFPDAMDRETRVAAVEKMKSRKVEEDVAVVVTNAVETIGEVTFSKAELSPGHDPLINYALDIAWLQEPQIAAFPQTDDSGWQQANGGLISKPGYRFAILPVIDKRSKIVMDDQIKLPGEDPVLAGLSFSKPGVDEQPRQISSEWHPVAVNSRQVELTPTAARLFLRENLRPMGEAIRLLPGETLGHLAEWLKLPVWRLRQLNSITNSRKLKSGQKILLDFRAVDQQAFLEKRLQFHMKVLETVFKRRQSIRLRDYRVQPGDNLWRLASNSHKFPVNLLLYFNEFDKLERLYPGDVIRLPVLE